MTAPILTYIDDATGEHTALTAAELGEWSAATAAMLTEGCRLGPGTRAGVLLPPHWQTAAVLLGAWAAGVEISFRGWSTAGLTPAGEPLDVTFVDYRRVGSWLDDIPAGGYQYVLGRPSEAEVPRGYLDWPAEVEGYLGSAPPSAPVRAHAAATVDGTTFAEYERLAASMAEARGFGRGDRVLIDASATEAPVMWLLSPLSAGASIVLCANLDLARIDDKIKSEKITKTLIQYD